MTDYTLYTAQELQEIVERHSRNTRGNCTVDRELWPCTMRDLALTILELQANPIVVLDPDTLDPIKRATTIALPDEPTDPNVRLRDKAGRGPYRRRGPNEWSSPNGTMTFVALLARGPVTIEYVDSLS